MRLNTFRNEYWMLGAMFEPGLITVSFLYWAIDIRWDTIRDE